MLSVILKNWLKHKEITPDYLDKNCLNFQNISFNINDIKMVYHFFEADKKQNLS